MHATRAPKKAITCARWYANACTIIVQSLKGGGCDHQRNK